MFFGSILDYFWLCSSNHSHTILMSLHTYDPKMVKYDCRKFRSIALTFLEKIERVLNWPFPGHLGPLLAVCQITDIRFWCHCTHRTLIWCRITVENFVRNRKDNIWKNWKSSKTTVFWSFLDYFQLCLSNQSQKISMPLHTWDPKRV